MSGENGAQKPSGGPCESCSRLEWDEDLGDWVCLAEPDEDEYFDMLSSSAQCVYYRAADDYDLSRRQSRPF